MYKKIEKRLIGSLLKTDEKYPFLGKDLIVGISGGIDSGVLYHLLREYYKNNNFSGKIYPVHVGISGDLKTNLPDVINVEVKEDISFPIDCYLCSRIRRKYIFQFAKEVGCKYVLFAHHADDFAERFLWNLFFQKKLESLPIKRDYFGEVTVLRPFFYIQKNDIKKYAKKYGITDNEHKCSVKNMVTGFVKRVSKQVGINYIELVGNINYIIENYKIYGEKDE
ncbi:hypothetical protein OWM07_10380 [Deferribacter thermophilus]|uniref:ATP-binding protein n=1 Tax=Deferribacter thermophilus TaxID=53573 RepID=UPI003C15BBC7